MADECKVTMSSRERMLRTLHGELPDRIPFVPAIYEHAAYLIGKTPSEVAQSCGLVVDAHLRAYDVYRYDLISLGIDIYNVEAEALGCKVQFSKTNATPSIVTHVLENSSDCGGLSVPAPETSGRMPLYLRAAEMLQAELGQDVLISGTIVGPFTLSALLRGFEQFIMDAIYNTEFFEELMAFSCEVAAAYGSAFISRGVGITINESWCSPPLVSPNLYKTMIARYHKALLEHFRSQRVSAALVIGGNTQPIFDDLVAIGASMLIADYGCDVARCKELARDAEVTLRANVDPRLVHDGPIKAIREEGERISKIGAPGGRFLLGMGVVPYDTPSQNVLALKDLACQWSY